MKTITYFAALFITVLIASISCVKENSNNNNSSGYIAGQVTANSGCKNLKSANGENPVPDSISCVEYSFEQLTKKLIIKHVNAGFNCCPGELYCKISLNNDTIIIEEFEKEAMCDCSCLFDLDIEITGVNRQKYFVKFIEPYVGYQQKIEFEIDLANTQNGSYCVVRKDYPWGR